MKGSVYSASSFPALKLFVLRLSNLQRRLVVYKRLHIHYIIDINNNFVRWILLSLVTQPCPTICNLMECRTPGVPVHHKLPEFTQIHVHRVGDIIQPASSVIPFSSCLQSFPASGSLPMSQFLTSGGQNVGASASAQSFQWILRVDFL